jgi:glucose/arabinose dehydrogenase
MKYGLPLLLLLAGCADWFKSPVAPPPPPPPGPPPPPAPAALHTVGNFANPTFATSPPGDTIRLFVTERAGRIMLLKYSAVQGAFLDLRGKISDTVENGLYSMAFHPQYRSNGRFYVFFTDVHGDIRVVRYTASTTNPDSANASSADTVLAVPHPLAGTSLSFGNHHGGQLQFGPDGMLYVSLGDGGCCGDPLKNGQRHHTMNAKILRINVDGPTGYTVPADNPFVADTSFPPETWAWGFRNPWRFSFDRQTGDLYIGDVGEATWEEVDVAAAPNPGKGVNYGWSIMEGMHCVTSGCNQTGLTPPIIEYGHINGNCDVQGGYVYRGAYVTPLIGYYLYADYCSGVIGGFKYAGGAATAKQDFTIFLSPGAGVVSFGEDGRGELYLMTYGGTLYRIDPSP